MVEIWIQLVVNERIWHVVSNTTNVAGDDRVRGDTAFYTMDKYKKHYFYFNLNGVHYVLFGDVQRLRMYPSFRITKVNRANFNHTKARNVGRYSKDVVDISCECATRLVKCKKNTENGGLSCELRFFDFRPDDANDNNELFQIIVDEQDIPIGEEDADSEEE